MTDPRDADGDSQMGDATSPSSNSEDAMFPSANADLDSGPMKSSQGAGVKLLSPSYSQRQGLQNDGPVDYVEDLDAGSGGFGKSGEDRFMPGASWNNKKARDEWQRAWAMVEDKNFNLKEFGDIFDEKLLETQPKRK